MGRFDLQAKYLRLDQEHGAYEIRCLICADHELVVVAPTAHPIQKILYLLDGNAAFDELALDALVAKDGLAIVAVGYCGAAKFDLDRRSRDYTPLPPAGWDGGSRRALDRPYGGAAEFRARLVGEIVPMAEHDLNAGKPQRILWGHSYGGLFAFWALMCGDESFDAVHAASPSLWWGDYMLERQVEAGQVNPDAGTQLALSMGDSEVSRTGERLYSPERLEALAQSLRVNHEMDCQVTIFDEAGHGATFARSLAHTIDAL